MAAVENPGGLEHPGELSGAESKPEPPHCPACGAAEGSRRGRKSGYDIFRCRACGTLFTGSAAPNYDSYYHDDGSVAVPAFIHLRLKQIVEGFAPYRRENRLLDLGCGSGILMQSAAQAGWSVEGLDVSQTAAARGRSLGYEVFCGDLLQAKYPGEHFDVVAASELLEHVPDPKAIINEVARILRPGGLFWATTPHGQGLSARLLRENWSAVCPPDHLQLFSRRGMRLILTQAGFRQVRIALHGVNPVEILHCLRKPGASHGTPGGDRKLDSVRDGLDVSYTMNEALMRNRVGEFAKYCANGLLSLGRLGDSMKIHAVR